MVFSFSQCYRELRANKFAYTAPRSFVSWPGAVATALPGAVATALPNESLPNESLPVATAIDVDEPAVPLVPAVPATPARQARADKQTERTALKARRAKPLRLSAQLCARHEHDRTGIFTFKGRLFRVLMVNKSGDYAVLGRLVGALDCVDAAPRAMFMVVPVRASKIRAGIDASLFGRGDTRATATSATKATSRYGGAVDRHHPWRRAVEFHRASGRVDKGHQLLGGPLEGWVGNAGFIQLLVESVSWVPGKNGCTYSVETDSLQRAACQPASAQQDARCTCTHVSATGVATACTLAYVRSLIRHPDSLHLHAPRRAAYLRGKFELLEALQAAVAARAVIPDTEKVLMWLALGLSPLGPPSVAAPRLPSEPRALFCNGQDLDDDVVSKWGSAVRCRCGLRLPGGGALPGDKHGWDERPGAQGCAHAKKLARGRVMALAVHNGAQCGSARPQKRRRQCT